MPLRLDGTYGVSGVVGTASSAAVYGDDVDSGIVFGTNQTTITAGGVGVGTFNTSGVNVTGSVTATGLSTFSGGINVGNTFLRATSIGIGTTNTTGRNAGVSTAQGTLIFNSDTGSVQVYNGNAWRDVGKEAINATGGLINEYTDSTTGKIYRAHIFTSSGFFTVPSAPPSATVDYLVVGGGGGTASINSGGGGAGGFSSGSGIPISVSPGSYAITVGAGGRGGSFPGQGPDAAPGSSSVFGPITSLGGGRGSGDGVLHSPGSFGSGGGGGGNPANPPSATNGGSTTGQSGTPGQGNPGGNLQNPEVNAVAAGGGGGAGGAGANGSITSQTGSGDGGVGSLNSITGVSTHYAGGGGGAWICAPSPRAGNGYIPKGGLGGGGNGGTDLNGQGSNGQVSTGGGGGGSRAAVGSAGGSGIVVVRYEIGQVGGTAKATGGAITYTPTTTVHTFYSSGVFTVTNPALTSVSMLMVGGGGGGGGTYHAGGGGAGGLLYTSSLPVSVTSYPVVIGSGGAGGYAAPGHDTNKGKPGANTTVFSLTAVGGGAGGGYPSGAPNGNGDAGGSGGGGGSGPPGSPLPGGSTNQTSPTAVQGYGNPGGAGFHFGPYAFGGGGGGAGEAGYIGGPGTPGGTVRQGGGGNGLAFSINGTSQYYAGGGGGSIYNAASGTNPQGANFRTQGGLGGGGRGGTESATASVATGENGVISTGGGGGGSDRQIPSLAVPGGSGGSGIVIIAYPS